MHRRKALGVVGSLAASTVIAGCASQSTATETQTRDGDRAPSATDSRDLPNSVYYPSHVDGMEMVGMDSQNGYKCALTYTLPHRFWLVTGTRRKVVPVQEADAVHLMPIVWDAETGIIPPDVNPQVTIRQGSSTVTQLSPWPMLSQPMGFHFGDNVGLDGEGTYQVEISIGEPASRRTGSLSKTGDGSSFDFEMEFAESTLDDITIRQISAEQRGTAGAVEPMSMDMLPSSQVPTEADLPGEVRGSGSSGDASVLVTVLDDATAFGGEPSEQYLAISPRTPYNRYPLTHMSISATLERDGETIYDDILTETVDPELHTHYGVTVDSVESGDVLTTRVDAPPQTARHVGYERSFIDMSSVTIEL